LGGQIVNTVAISKAQIDVAVIVPQDIIIPPVMMQNKQEACIGHLCDIFEP